MTPTDWMRHFEGRHDALLTDLEALVRHESPSDDAACVNRLAGFIVERLRGAGVDARAVPCPTRGDAVLAALGSGPGGCLLLGHHDTVWPLGTLAERPFKVAEERASGPGCFDMKAGIAVAIGVLEALAAQARPPRVSLLLTPDEEVGTLASRSLLLETAREHACVFVLEPSLDGAAKLARKGTASFEATFRGVPAHAGLEPEKGASALLELARFALFAQGLGDPRNGTTLTPTLCRAGSASNVVPEGASVTLDGRVWEPEEAIRIEEALRGYRPTDPRVSVTVGGGFDRPPLRETPAVRTLFQRAVAVAAQLGQTLGGVRVGGASDGNLTAAAGVPTLDGLGPRGDGAHARHEHVWVSDLPFRAALIASLTSPG